MRNAPLNANEKRPSEKHWPIFIAKEAVKQANALIAELIAEESK